MSAIDINIERTVLSRLDEMYQDNIDKLFKAIEIMQILSLSCYQYRTANEVIRDIKSLL